jgi:hypothetical protein
LNVINEIALWASTNWTLISLLVLVTIHVGCIQSRHKFICIFFENVTLVDTLLLITVNRKVTCLINLTYWIIYWRFTILIELLQNC